jgi:hypothetical protein
MYNSYPDREIKFGISDAQTYHWLHAMNALGRVNVAITADYPIAAAFILNGDITYVAHNYSNAPITVNFSTGHQLLVPAFKMATSKDSQITGVISSSFQQAYVNGSVKLNVVASGGTPTKVEFMDGATSKGIISTAPFEWNATNLQLGMHSFYAKVYDGEKFNVTNIADVQVGSQVPYEGTAWAIPGAIEAGKYDVFEGGKGQNIAYMDVTTANSGDFRMSEYVDANSDAAEGAYVASLASGEWVEYTVNVTQAGLYSFAFRYASGNSAGGGPFHLELDGQTISSDISVPSTSTTVWNVWATKTVTGISLTPGQHVLRVAFSNGEFNLAKMTFARTGDLTYSYPTAIAGGKLILILPQTSATLNGSASTESAGQQLSFKWTQNYGPSPVQFSNPTSPDPVTNFPVEGMYSLKLTVTNPDQRTDEDELLVAVSSTANILPTVSLVSPADNSTYTAGKPLTIAANASDFDGSIQKVDFFQNNILISSDNTAPYLITWNPTAGNYVLTGVATDNGGAVSNSQAIDITIAPMMSCADTSKTATQGSFSLGYICTFETVGTTVTVTFELLDTDKPGLVAYLWKESPFAESLMTNVSGKIFSATLNGQTIGATISYACKFAYSGGMAVTKYCSYQVGKNCNTAGIENPSARPLIFFPNPVSNDLYISNIGEKSTISIYDLNGKLLLSKTSGFDSEKIDVSFLSNGIYIIKVTDNTTIRACRMIKQ